MCSLLSLLILQASHKPLYSVQVISLKSQAHLHSWLAPILSRRHYQHDSGGSNHHCLHDAELQYGQEAGHQLEFEQVLLVELVDAGLGCLVFNFTSADVVVKLCIGKA